MKYLLITNPISGPRSDTTKEITKWIAKEIERRGNGIAIQETECEGHGYEIALEALHNDYDMVVAMGGDGTVNEVAHALVGTDKCLGIIPNGSGNGLARELLIPLDAKAAVDILLQQNIATIDTCTANEEPFFVTCGIGFDGKVSKEFAKSDSRGITTYAKEVVTEYFNYHPHDYHILIDGKEVTATAFIVAVANASQYGNNAFIAPNASMTDGLLDLTILKPFPALEAPKIVLQLFTKGIDKNEYTSFYKGKQIEIITTRPVNYHIDGEAKQKTSKLSIEIHPATLKVICGKDGSRNKSVIDFFKEATNSFSEFTTDLLDRFK